MANYFNQLSLAQKLDQLGQCRFMDQSEFDQGVDALKGKKIVIVGMWCSRAQPRSQYARLRFGHQLTPCVKEPSIKRELHSKMLLTIILMLETTKT